MRYLPTIDVHATGITEAILSGALRLQSGQWVRCGSGPRSRFDYATKNYIRAYHGATSGDAGRKYNRVKRSEAILAAFNAARAAYRIEPNKTNQITLEACKAYWVQSITGSK